MFSNLNSKLWLNKLQKRTGQIKCEMNTIFKILREKHISISWPSDINGKTVKIYILCELVYTVKNKDSNEFHNFSKGRKCTADK